MEDAIVIYTSRTGFTQQYALWVARELHCEVLDSKFVTKTDLQGRRIIIYGGHVVGHHVTGFRSFLGKYQQVCHRRLVVFGTGMRPETSLDLVSVAQTTNQLMADKQPFFYFQGEVETQAIPLWRRAWIAYFKHRYQSELSCSQQIRVDPLVRHVEQMI